MARATKKTEESKEGFKKTPEGWHKRWLKEITASEKMLEEFHKKARLVVDRFIDERENNDDQTDSRVNLFWANTNNMRGVTFANLPKADVGRKFEDSDDDVARVAALLMGRLLNYDIQENGEEYGSVLSACLEDRLVPGLGVARVYYDYEDEEVEHPAIMADDGETEEAEAYTETKLLDEWCTIDHFFWGDVLWSWAREWKDIRWLAFRNYMDKEDVEERFGKEASEQVQYQKQKVRQDDKTGSDGRFSDVFESAEVWEIWSKEENKVFFYSKGAKKILEEKDDPLRLRGFWPCPPFFVANVTTSFFMPKPDFVMAQDLYNEIDILETRISYLTEAVKVVGVYDSSSEGIKRMLMEGVENELIPVDSWAMFAEKGGIQGQVDWLPIEVVVGALETVRQIRDDNLLLLDKVTGWSDILQGSGTAPREAKGTQELKAQIGSIRIQALQDQFAEFASNLLELKAEVISKHCEPETIAAMSNAEFIMEADRQLVPQALELIKDWGMAALKIKIRSETVAMINYTQLKQERTEYINAMAMFMQSAAPLVEQSPEAVPTLLEMLKWGLAGFKGSIEIEGVLDKAIEDMRKKPPGKDKEDPEAKAKAAEAQAKVQELQLKHKNAMKELEAKFTSRMQEIQAESKASQAEEQNQAHFANLEREAEAQYDRELLELEHEFNMQEARANAQVSSSQD